MNARMLLGTLAAVGVIGSSASGVVINPGQTLSLGGTSAAQSPWIAGPSPTGYLRHVNVFGPPFTVIYSCELLISLRVSVPLAQPTLQYRFQNTWADDPSRRIVSVSFTGYKDLLIDADFRTDTEGVGDPKRVRRSADGDTLTFEFETPIDGDVVATRFFFAHTNAATLAFDGTATVTLQTGESRTITGVPRPTLGVAPPAPPCPGDTTGDGVVNFADLNSVLTNFGEACP